MRAKGTQKTGGRVKGTPNKVTQTTREWVQMLINNNRRQLERDLAELEAKERWQVIEKLMQYTLPKMQSVESEINHTSDQPVFTGFNFLPYTSGTDCVDEKNLE
jgi:hypothetical protein